VSTGFSGVGNGVSFGGTVNDYIDIPNNALLTPSTTLTYECWAFHTSFAGFPTMMAQGTAVASPDGLALRASNSGVLQIVLPFSGAVQMTGTATLSTSTWYYIVVTCATSNVWTFYINGTQDKQSTLGLSPPTATSPFDLGVDFNGSRLQPMANGSALCFCCIYPTALSASQVAAHYAARNTATSTGGTTNSSPPGQAVAALAHERNQQRKEQEQPGHRLRLSDYYRRRHG